jgi:hypothetical protein
LDDEDGAYIAYSTRSVTRGNNQANRQGPVERDGRLYFDDFRDPNSDNNRTISARFEVRTRGACGLIILSLPVVDDEHPVRAAYAYTTKELRNLGFEADTLPESDTSQFGENGELDGHRNPSISMVASASRKRGGNEPFTWSKHETPRKWFARSVTNKIWKEIDETFRRHREVAKQIIRERD